MLYPEILKIWRGSPNFCCGLAKKVRAFNSPPPASRGLNVFTKNFQTLFSLSLNRYVPTYSYQVGIMVVPFSLFYDFLRHWHTDVIWHLITHFRSQMKISKKLTTVANWKLWKCMESKKSKFENNIKWGPKMCKMTGGFQIWPQNWNWITFDPFWPKKKLSKMGKLASITHVAKIYLNEISRNEEYER